ncbi:MAG: hypothetical protein WC410_03650 [Candidatus Paceibacterota bacterium]|jgi:hypothetical protein
MKNTNLKLAQYVLEKGTSFCGVDFAKIDTATFFIEHIKEELGIFEKEIREFIDLLERLRIVDKVTYVDASTINPEITGFAYECEMNIPKMKEFIERGAGEATVFDPIKSTLTFKSKEFSVPRDTDQFEFCKKMYEYPTDQWVSWDLIYSEAKGLKTIQTIPEKGKWKVVYDTMIEINKKAKEKLGIVKLFKYNKHEFLRTI